MADINRRAFLAGAMASTAAIALPGTAGPALPETLVGEPVSFHMPRLKAYAVGTPGKYDWQVVRAFNEDQAKEFFLADLDLEPFEAAEYDVDYKRVEAWDSKPTVTTGDWINEGFGSFCDRCSCEAHPENGALNVEGLCICEDCVTVADRAPIDPKGVAEDLANRIADEGADDVRESLQLAGYWPAIEGEIWTMALTEASNG